MAARSMDPRRLLAAVSAQRADLGAEPWAGPVTVAALGAACVDAVATALDAGLRPQADALRLATIYALSLLAARAPGRAVEVRIPPFGATQCVPGPRHARGTPPNVVETDAATWIRLVTGRIGWPDAISGGLVRASGPRSDLSDYLPLPPACRRTEGPGSGS